MKIITIVGARPQFIKAASVSRAISSYNESHLKKIEEKIIHTGQHFDKNMSEVFFKELELKEPNYNLEISKLSHGAMTGRMLEAIESILSQEKPDVVIIHGDTNSTLAGALAASKMHIPVAHIEAGLRSFNMSMPEEINRIVSDKVSTLLFCPTETAVNNLANEGVTEGVYQVGDVMYDVALFYKDQVLKTIDLKKFNVQEKNYCLCTIHRAENTENLSRLQSIFETLKEIRTTSDVVLPLHPRTKKIIEDNNHKSWLDGLIVTPPLSYFEMMRLQISAKIILTDSGGVQKEAFFNKIPCITMRDETEWMETVELGWNKVTGVDKKKIITAYNDIALLNAQKDINPFGNGDAARQIIDILQATL